MYGLCNVWVCVCMDFVRSGCVFVWVLNCVGVCAYGLAIMRLCVCMRFVMSGCV